MLTEKQINEIKSKVEPDQNETILCEAFRVLGDKNRYRIIKTLLEAGELCVGDLALIIGISMSATSQHLRILEMSRMVESERMGQMMCYRPIAGNPKIKSLIRLMTK
jgi:DNA-binding transcriptional ArsR family regulator